jgi:hypothetical protein
MRNRILAGLFALCVAVSFAASSAKAEEYALRVNIPFEFVLGNDTYQPGEYVIERLRTSTSAHGIKGKDVGTMMLTQQHGWFKGDSSSVVFNRYGDSNFLTSIRVAESGIVYSVPKSKLETELIGQGSRPAVEVLAAMTR